MPRLTRPESQARTRDLLLAAARAVFLRDGYVRASLDAIADQAGFSKGAIYSNFEGKEALFLELLRAKFAADIQALEALLATNLCVDALIDAVQSSYERRADVLDFTLVSAEFGTQVTLGSVHAQAYAELYAAQRGVIEALVTTLVERSGRCRAAAVGHLGAAFVAMTVGLAIQRRVDPEAVTPALWGAAVAEYLRKIIGVSA